MGSIFDFLFYLFFLAITGLTALYPRTALSKRDYEPSQFRVDMTRIISSIVFFIFLISFIHDLFF
ncbi:hypothetical protein EDM54_05920 [Brevibacillus borstelensis]|uniref:Uncharacterized protein n=1 Tax=Brevibacillus borstelensis AK1 TaxID=1300222 RepID=M8D795_9BACL|nr:hypothetical protein I532_14688 [Brevibacillus borstelensis AK1]KKX53523.1 hypothetical protein X546_19275 [Brevibacillus borstelensis cifa_chp40]RNB64783.1 hypothetical protein EDM54_05920 [Brevibacillus borstelensis]